MQREDNKIENIQQKKIIGNNRKNFHKRTLFRAAVLICCLFIAISYRLINKRNSIKQSSSSVYQSENIKEGTSRPITKEKNEDNIQNCSQLAAKGRYEEALKCVNEQIPTEDKAFSANYNTETEARFGNREIDALYQKYKKLDLQGRPQEAIKYAEELIPMAERAFGKNHPNIEIFLNNLIFQYKITGDLEKAGAVLNRILKIREETLGLEDPVVIHSLYNLIACYFELGEFTKAERLCMHYQAKFEKVLGSEHPFVATIIDILAEIYFIAGDYKKIVQLFERSLSINEKAYGPEHYMVANCMKNLALVHKSLGNTDSANLYFERSLAIYAKSSEMDHPDKAMLYARQSQHEKAHYLMMQAQEMDNKSIDWIMSFASEEKKLKFMATKRWELHTFLSHIAQYLIDNPTAKKDALNIWLRRKGIILEAQKRFLEASMYSAEDAGLKAYEKLGDVRAMLSKLTLVGPEHDSFELYKKKISELKNQKEKLELLLSQSSRSYALKVHISKADCQKVAASMQPNSVLIEFARVKLFDFTAKGEEPKWKSPHYFAFILRAGMADKVELIDLGNADVIDKSIFNFKKCLDESDHLKNHQIDATSRKIYNLVFAPLKNELDGLENVYISPDGNLNLIPFEVLLGPDGKFLIETYTFNYLAAGRDILRFRQIQKSGNNAVLMGDPEFNLESKEKVLILQDLNLNNNENFLQASRTVYFEGFNVQPLEYAKKELDAIESIIGKDKTEVYTGKEALEEVLTSKKAPRILHIATHGFFRSDQNYVKQGIRVAGRGWYKPESSSFNKDGRIMDFENPLLRSGIYLAGANTMRNSISAGTGDGIVTAEKILGLNLYGTEMVVLSACDTGLGEVKTGEGVFGMRRAFTQAGAQSLVMSMWKVPDKETKELMVQFYKNIYKNGMNRCQALRQASLSVMQVVSQRYGHVNPRYWGAFVFMGEP